MLSIFVILVSEIENSPNREKLVNNIDFVASHEEKPNPESFQNSIEPSKLILDRIDKSPCCLFCFSSCFSCDSTRVCSSLFCLSSCCSCHSTRVCSGLFCLSTCCSCRSTRVCLCLSFQPTRVCFSFFSCSVGPVPNASISIVWQGIMFICSIQSCGKIWSDCLEQSWKFNQTFSDDEVGERAIWKWKIE